MAEETTEQVQPESTQQSSQLQAGPWQSDIQAAFTDPQVQATVDAFLRSKIQPRMTQLEQQIATAENAKALYDAFQANPAAAYAQVTRELYGDAAAQAALEALDAQVNPQQPQPAAEQPAAQPEALPQYDPTTQMTPEELQAWREERELQAYDRTVEAILSDPANADINRDRYHTFVAAANGDFAEAIERYRADTAAVLVAYGIDPSTATPAQLEGAAEVAESQQSAPPTLGNATGGSGPAPPTERQYRGKEGLDQAINDAVNDMLRKDSAPPVS